MKRLALVLLLVALSLLLTDGALAATDGCVLLSCEERYDFSDQFLAHFLALTLEDAHDWWVRSDFEITHPVYPPCGWSVRLALPQEGTIVGLAFNSLYSAINLTFSDGKTYSATYSQAWDSTGTCIAEPPSVWVLSHDWGLDGSCQGGTSEAPSMPGVSVAIPRSPSPNPFLKSTQFLFALDRDAHVRVEVFDLGGRRVRRILDAPLPSGEHSLAWDGRSDNGLSLPAGMYVINAIVGDHVRSRKVVLLR